MIRVDLLDTQLEALAAAYTAVPGADLRVMAPMVATVEEAEYFAEKVRAASGGFGAWPGCAAKLGLPR